MVMYAAVDYGDVLGRAAGEADAIVWDGGNNDFPFFAPDLLVVVTDALRAGQELGYHPGETNLRMADVIVVNKVDSAEPSAVRRTLATIAAVNPNATVVRAESPVTLGPGPDLRGQRVLVIEDGPTVTHGGMPFGAGTVAARQGGAGTIVDLYIGEEAVAVGVMQALGADDAVVATYREHGHALTRGVSSASVMAEMFGKVEGCSRGRGGPSSRSATGRRSRPCAPRSRSSRPRGRSRQCRRGQTLRDLDWGVAAQLEEVAARVARDNPGLVAPALGAPRCVEDDRFAQLEQRARSVEQGLVGRDGGAPLVETLIARRSAPRRARRAVRQHRSPVVPRPLRRGSPRWR